MGTFNYTSVTTTWQLLFIILQTYRLTDDLLTFYLLVVKTVVGLTAKLVRKLLMPISIDITLAVE